MLHFDEFAGQMQMLVSKTIWSVTFGPSTGSNLNMEIGEKRRRITPLKNPKLTDDERSYAGEMSLYVQCAWRIESETEILCGSGADLGRDDIRHLIAVEGTTIDRLALDSPSLDFRLQLSNGSKFIAFCDEVIDDEFRDNYSLFSLEKVFTVGARSILRVSDYDSATVALRSV